jgi:hypothetical protein
MSLGQILDQTVIKTNVVTTNAAMKVSLEQMVAGSILKLMVLEHTLKRTSLEQTSEV